MNLFDPFNMFTPSVLTSWPMDPDKEAPSPIVLAAIAYSQWFATMQILTRPSEGDDDADSTGV